MKKIIFQNHASWALAFLVAVSAGLYFRTYLLQPSHTPTSEKMAAFLVERTIAAQIEKALDAQNPGLASDDKLKLAHEQAQRMIQSDPVNYQRALEQAVESVRKNRPPPPSRHYLLEADPYYYLYLTEQIVQHGKMAEKIRNGEYYHPLMHAPYGYWTAITWHPYVGWFVGNVIRFFQPQREWMEVLCWVPLILTVLACLCFLFLSRALNVDSFSFFIGAMALMLSPIFIQRSGFGWYDTDPYNYIFPFLILTAVFTAFQKPAWSRYCACVSGFLTGLYGLFWTGWPFMLLLVPGAILAALMTAWVGFRVSPKLLRPALSYFILHLVWAVLFAALFLTPAGFLKSIQLGWEILRRFSLADPDVWPNIFLTVGEARGASLKKLIYLSGNYITSGIAGIGVICTGFNVWRIREPQALMRWLFLFFFSAPLFVMPFQTERFGVLFVIPLCLWTSWGVGEIQTGLSSWFYRFSFFSRRQNIARLTARVLIALVFLPLPIFTAHIVSLGVKPIMDEAWYQTMQEIREKTPENAIINSWWPPGYFTVALAHRRVIADGGTQHLHESYWMARILTSEDEKEAAGLLRMLNQSGNEALLFLKSLNMDLEDAVKLILAVVPVSREEARIRLPQEMAESVKTKFLNLTHGQKPMPASYVLVYDDLVEQNLAVTTIARWDFKKAREMKIARAAKNGVGRRSSDYVQDFMKMTGDILHYTPAVSLQKKEGDVLYFPNGLMVHLSEMDAFISLPQKNIQGRPASLFFMRDGNLQEKPLAGSPLDVSVLLIQDPDGGYRAVLADARLIRSLLFRLYYLRGEGLRLFQPFSSHDDPATGNHVNVFEFKAELLQNEVPHQVAV